MPQIFRDIPQRSKDWFALRRGRICSSHVGDLVDSDGNLKRGRSKGDSIGQGVRSYVAQLVSERISGYIELDTFSSAAMEYGVQHEAAARAALEFQTGLTFVNVGGCLSDCGRWWASADGIATETDGAVWAVAEIKIPLPKSQVKYLLDSKELMDEYEPQLYHEMLVTQAQAGYLFSYGPGLSARRVNVLCEVSADDPFIENLRASLERVDELVREALRSIGASETLPPVAMPEPAKSDREWFAENFGTPTEAAR